MPLTKTVLESGLLALAKQPTPPTRGEALRRFVDVYDAYASLATASGVPMQANGGSERLSLALRAAWETPIGAPATLARALGDGIAAYWTGVTFNAPGAVGTATPPAGVVVLTTALTALFSVPNELPAAVDALASSMDACTRTVIGTVTFTGAAAVSGPII